MKKLLFILFILPVFCFAQSPVTPSFKRKIPIDSLLGYSFPGVTGIFWLPDTAWVKKHASGSFLNNSTSKQTSANGYVDGFLRGQKLIADSDIYIRTTTKKAWYSAYGVLNMAGDVGIRGETGAHDLMMYNNLYAVGTAFTDFKYANNGAASYLYLGVAGSLSYGAAPSGTAGTSATVTDWLKIDVNGHTFLPGLRDTTTTDTIVGYKNHQLYKIPFSATLAANGLKKVGDTIIQAGNINRPTAISLDDLAGTGNTYFIGDTLNRAGIEVDINSGSVGAALEGKNADGSQTSNVFADAGEAQINASGSLGSKSINLQADGDMTITDSQSKGLTNTGDYSNYIVNHDNALVTKKAAVRLIDSLGSGGGSGHNIYTHDGTQTDALRTDSLGANHLQFIGDDGTDIGNITLGADGAIMDIQSATGEGTFLTGDNGTTISGTDKVSGNSANVVTGSLNGGFISMYYSKLSGGLQKSFFIDSVSMLLSDAISHSWAQYADDYSINSLSNQRAIPDVGGVHKMIDSLGTGGGSDTTALKSVFLPLFLDGNKNVNIGQNLLQFNSSANGADSLSFFMRHDFMGLESTNTSGQESSFSYQPESFESFHADAVGNQVHVAGSDAELDMYVNNPSNKSNGFEIGLDHIHISSDIEKIGMVADSDWTANIVNNQNAYTTTATVTKLIDSLASGGGSPAWGLITGTLSDQTDLQTALDAKQATLVSGTTIKTINSTNILASGNLNLQTPLTAGTDYLAPTGSAAALTGLLSSQVTTALGFTPENVANKSTTTTLGTSNTLYPTQNAVKTYVDALSSVYQPIGTYATATNSMAFSNKTGNISQWTNDSGYITSAPVASVFGRTGTVVAASNDYTFAQIGSKPTTLSGYGITDAYPLSGNPSSFLTGNQSISFAPTGEVTGTTSGTTSLAPALTVSNSAVIGKVLTGYTSAAGTVAATDNILQAIQKLNGNDGLKAPIASPTFTGSASAAGLTVQTFGGTGSNMWQGSQVNIISSSATPMQFAGSSTVYARAGFGLSTTSTTIGSGNSYENTVIGSAPFTTASASTTPWAANLVVAPFGTITLGASGASLTNVATLFVGAAPATGTNKYTAYFDIGNVQLANGNLTLGTAGNEIKVAEGTNGTVGQVALVSGTKAITITGITTSTRAFVTLVSPTGTSLTTSYQAVCTANTLTLQANVAAGTINIADGSTLNYFVIN